MKKFVLIFLFAMAFCNCTNVQTQQVSENKPQPTPTITNVNTENEHVGYARFATSDKQYLGCWRSVEASEVVNYELNFFRLTEKTIQTSKMSKSVSYKEIESNKHKDWFVLQTESKNNELQPYLNINMVSDDEMTIGELTTKNLDGEYENYWDLKREDCGKIISKFRK